MATRITSQLLNLGEYVQSSAWTPGETLALTIAATQSGTATSQIRITVHDADRHTLASRLIEGSNTRKLLLNGLDGTVTVTIECLRGAATVVASDPTGGAMEAADIATGAVGAAEIATDAVDSAEIAALAVDTAELANDAVTEAKLAVSAKGLGVQNLEVVADPGDAGTIDVSGLDGSATCALTVGTGVETRVLSAPAFVGQVVVLTIAANGGGTAAITNTDGWRQGGAGEDVATSSAATDVMVLVGIGVTDAQDWYLVAYSGIALS